MNAPIRTGALTTGADTPEYRVMQAAPTGRDLILQADNLNAMLTVAKVMANSRQAVPKHLRTNEGGCLAVVMQAMRWNMDPFALAAKTYTVDPEAPIAYEGQAIIAALNNSPLLATRLSFEWDGPWEKIIGKFVWRTSPARPAEGNKPAKKETKFLAKNWSDDDEAGLRIIVRATLVGETAPRVLELFLMQARTRNSPLWVEDPRQQLAYLAGRRWGRLHAPDVIMGVYTPDELMEFPPKDMGDAEVVEPELDAATRANMDEAAAKGTKGYSQFWMALPIEVRNELLFHPHHEACKKHALEVDTANKNRTVDTGKSAQASAPAQAEAKPAADPVAAPAAAPAADPVDPEAAFTPTYARIADMIVKATEPVAVEVAAEWIPELADAKQRADLEELAEQRIAELTKAAP